MALSAAIRTGNRYGSAYLTDILLGKENDKNKRHRHLPTYGVGKGHDVKVWRSVLRQLVSLGYLTAGPYQGLTVTGRARGILRGEVQLLLREDTVKPRVPKRERAQATRVAIGAHDRPLFLALRSWRAERAGQLKVPPYVIFSDATLKAVAELRPGSLHTLGTVSGIGERRLAEYGSEVLRIVRSGVHEEQRRPRGTVQAHEFGLVPQDVTWETLAAPRIGPEVHDMPLERRDRAGLPELPEEVLERPDPLLPPPVEPVSPEVMRAQEEAVPMQPLEPSPPTEAQEPQPYPVVVAALQELRRELARETGYAAYVVFPNATLTALATRLPRTMADLIGLPGLGAKRIEAYGARILDAIDTELDES